MATTVLYTLSLHDALPIFQAVQHGGDPAARDSARSEHNRTGAVERRSEEHTSELQSRQYLVCRLLLEKKKREVAEGYAFQDEIREYRGHRSGKYIKVLPPQ